MHATATAARPKRMIPDDDTFQPDCGGSDANPANELPATDSAATDLTTVLVLANDLID